jgi:hypothetical protein
VLHDALTVDGVRMPVNITHNAFFSGATNNQFTNAVQLDSNSTAAPSVSDWLTSPPWPTCWPTSRLSPRARPRR